MKIVSASELRRRGLAVLDDADPAGVLVTRRGKSVARLVPIAQPSPSLFGGLAEKIRIVGDVTTTGIEWEAERPPTHS